MKFTVRGISALAIGRAQLLPDRLVIADDIFRLQNDDMRLGQKIECRRIVFAGGHDQRAAFRHRAEGVAHADEIARLGGSMGDVEPGRGKGQGGEIGVGSATDSCRQIAAAQIGRDRAGHLAIGSRLR